MTRHDSTDDLDRLKAALVTVTPAQQIAVELLAAGATQDEAAKAAGRSREVVNRWVNHHPGFRTALDECRTLVATEQANRALRVREMALAVVEGQLDGASLADALAVLRTVPVPTFDPYATPPATERLAADVSRLAATVRPQPKRRDSNGRILADFNSMDGLMYDVGAEEAERAERVATEQLADAAGVFDEVPAAGPEA